MVMIIVIKIKLNVVHAGNTHCFYSGSQISCDEIIHIT